MTEKQTPHLPADENTPQEETHPDTLASLFEERDRPLAQEESPEEKKGAEKSEASRKKLSLKEKKPEEKDTGKPQELTAEPDKDKEDEEEGDPQEDKETKKLRDELENARKQIQANRRFGHQNAQKVKTALKAVHNLIAEGSLTEEEAQGVLASLQIDQEMEEDAPQAAAHPFAPIFKTVGAELEHLRKYTDDALLDDKLMAFEYLIGTSTPEENEEIMETLLELIEEPVKLTRKVISLGNEAYEDFYKEIKKAGGVKIRIKNLEKENEKLKKKIDKLEKEENNQYDKATYRLNEMGETEKSSSDEDAIGSLFKERDRPVRRQ